jgi:hypothetical protein
VLRANPGRVYVSLLPRAQNGKISTGGGDIAVVDAA